MPELYPLQHLVMANLAHGAPDAMYVRCATRQARVRYNPAQLDFTAGGRVSFDTFFNSFTLDVWRKHTRLDDLQLRLAGEGGFILRFGLHRSGHGERWLAEQSLNLQAGQACTVAVPLWPTLESGMLYFSLEAVGDGCLTGGQWVTTTPPRQKVKLGIVITHFNRKHYVLPAIQRVNSLLLADPAYHDRLALVVVDNSRTITPAEAPGVTLIPNPNLGGSGGFTRGLLYLKDAGNFTHCLFMDDDAACEVESIRRADALLQYSITPRFAVAGSLLRALEPYRLFEKGACFATQVEGLKSGLDMRQVADLLDAEREDKTPDYGGWWFFAFAIDAVQHYPFPFFVRGDDILFGCSNRFAIATLNGIGCWGDDFSSKCSPLTRYLDTRYYIVMALLHPHRTSLAMGWMISRFFLSALFSYNYASARAARLALHHASLGPDFWRVPIAMQAVLAEIAGFAAAEKMRPIDRASLAVHYPPSYHAAVAGQPTTALAREKPWRLCLRLLTLNGMLLPSAFLKAGLVFQHKGFRGYLREIFAYKAVLYQDAASGLGYVAHHDKARFFKELLAFAAAMLTFTRNIPRLRRAYQSQQASMTSESFWRTVFAGNTIPPRVTPPAGQEQG